MTTKTELDEAFRRLAEGLSWLDGQEPDGRTRAGAIRTRLHSHLEALADGIAGKTQRCPYHRNQLAIACAPCRSERIAVPDYPPNPISDVDARQLGEGAQS